MVEEANEIKEALSLSTYRSTVDDTVAWELGSVFLAMDAAIADLGLATVDVRSTCNDFSSTGGCGLTGGTVPADFMYPNYLSFPLLGDGHAYSWDTTGLVTTP